MKKTIFAILTLLLVLCVSGCNNANNDTNNENKADKKTQANVKTDTVVVSNVIGMDKDEAVKMLEKKGLIVELQESSDFDESIENGQVIVQSFAAGTIVAYKSKIVLTYNSSRFRTDYIEVADFCNASIKGKLPSTIQSITIDNEHNGKPVAGFYLSTNDTASIDTIIIPENCGKNWKNCGTVCVNSPNITINKIIINGTKDAGCFMHISCKNTPVIEYTK